MSSRLKRPQALKPGDTVAVIRPSSRLEAKHWNQSIKLLRNEGFCVVTYPKPFPKDSFFSSSDRNRADEFLWALREPGIRAILVARGGYGSQRALRLLQSEIASLKRLPPKIIVGYSDATYLLQWVQNQLGWVAFHGPLVGFLDGRRMRAFVKDLLSLAKRPNSEAWSEVKNVGAKASARGKLVGGNLSLLTTLGPAALPREPVILALEDVNENHYRLDRMIGNLIDAGYARYVKGIVCGRFLNCGEKDRTSFPFSKIISSLRQLTRGPIWLGARFGHGVKHQRILSLGVKAALSGKKVSWRESAVESR